MQGKPIFDIGIVNEPATQSDESGLAASFRQNLTGRFGTEVTYQVAGVRNPVNIGLTPGS